MNDIERRRQKIAEAKAEAQAREPLPDEGPSRTAVMAGFVFVIVLAALALYFIHALTAPPAPILPPH